MTDLLTNSKIARITLDGMSLHYVGGFTDNIRNHFYLQLAKRSELWYEIAV